MAICSLSIPANILELPPVVSASLKADVGGTFVSTGAVGKLIDGLLEEPESLGDFVEPLQLTKLNNRIKESKSTIVFSC